MHQRSFFAAICIGLCLCSARGALAETEETGCEFGVFHWNVSGTVADRVANGALPLASATPESQHMDAGILDAGI